MFICGLNLQVKITTFQPLTEFRVHISQANSFSHTIYNVTSTAPIRPLISPTYKIR